MVLEQIRSYRLGPRGGFSLAFDADGVALGEAALVSAVKDPEGRAYWGTCSFEQLRLVLRLAYGAESEMITKRVGRGLERIATAFEKGDLAAAAIEAVMLQLPDVDAEALFEAQRCRNRQEGR